MRRTHANGFTLIEILVVVAIIGALVSIVYVNFGAARDNARNKAIRTSLSEVQLALEVYKAQNKRYPATLSLLVPEFISTLPTKSISGNSGCEIADGDLDFDAYSTDTDGTYYKFTARNCYSGATGAATGVQPSDEFARCPSTCSTCGGVTFDSAYKASATFYESMAVYSLGGQCQ